MTAEDGHQIANDPELRAALDALHAAMAADDLQETARLIERLQALIAQRQAENPAGQ